MGLTRGSLGFLLAAREAGVEFRRSVTLGRQGIWADARVIRAAHADVGQPIGLELARRIFAASDGYGDAFFRESLSADRIDSLDASDWEGSTLVHDMNHPIPEGWKCSYSAVIDGGTLEHVFNFPVALRNALEMVEVGGHYIGFSPANNWFGHGFYQFSPVLFAQALTPENGFRIRCILIQRADRPYRWYELMDPSVMGLPLVILGSLPIELYVLAERVQERDVFASYPQQWRYEESWQREAPDRSRPTLRRRLARLEPLPLKTLRFIFGPTLRHRRQILRRVDLRDLVSFGA